jgi:hypothetical protein
VTAVHTDAGGQPWSLVRGAGDGIERRWLRPVAAAVVTAGVTAAARRYATRSGRDKTASRLPEVT